MMLPMTGRILHSLAAFTAALSLASLAACSSTTGPPTAASLASKLRCHVSNYFTDGQWAYDTEKGANLDGGPCANDGSGMVIITFPSQAKEDDWLHQNATAESSNFPDGYFELVVGHLWVIGDPSGAAVNLSFVTRALGGK